MSRERRLGFLAVGALIVLAGVALIARTPHPVIRTFPNPGAGRADVVRLRTVYIPEGPITPPFERVPTGFSRPLSEIEAFIPDPLPAALDQRGCTVGENVVITLADGRTVTYGPCYRPSSINRLWHKIWGTLPRETPP
jgi:hypothetical protein